MKCPVDDTELLPERRVDYGDHFKNINNCPVCGFGVILSAEGKSSTRLDEHHTDKKSFLDRLKEFFHL